MANSTIYPYGTGGQLPSNIGLINDLVTGGVDKALTAQMGVELNALIEAAKIQLDYGVVGEDGIFFVDNHLNVGAKITNSGVEGFNLMTMEDI